MSTGAILNRLHSDRSRQRQLVLGGVVSVITVMVFLFVLERPSSPPPPPPALNPNVTNQHAPVRQPLRSHATPSPPELMDTPQQAMPAANSVRVHVSCTHGVGLWVDQRKYGNCKGLDIDLTAGPHTVIGRKGRHVMQQQVDLDAPVTIHIDGAKRRISVQKLH